MDIEHKGQVFTPETIVTQMLSLRRNCGTVLEPSCGNGAFWNRIPGCVGIELDAQQCPEGALCMDFFDYPADNKFDTVIGNPPYVRCKNILPETKEKLDFTRFDKRSDLYLFFIEKCIRHLNTHGELIFLVPRVFLKATSADRLHEFMYRNGTITDCIDLGDRKIFDNACPDCIIFRYEKDDMSHVMTDGRFFSVQNGQVLFLSENYPVRFSDLFYVKVGAATGANDIFRSDDGNMDFVYSETKKTGETIKMFYGAPAAKALVSRKDELLARKLKKFDDSNWYLYGRDYYKSDAERIYVNAKTRDMRPFFYHPCKAFDGSVLAVFPKFECADMASLADDLNNVNWNALGFQCGGRLLFSQKALEETVLPASFRKYTENTRMQEAC